MMYTIYLFDNIRYRVEKEVMYSCNEEKRNRVNRRILFFVGLMSPICMYARVSNGNLPLNSNLL